MKKFLNIRYVPKELLKSVKVYMIANGGFKECLPFVVTRKVVKPKNLYCDFDDMPKDVQDKFEDMAISEGENLSEIYFNRKGAYTFNSEGVKVVINEKTLLLPIVGNLLPSGDITPYTVLYDNGNFTLVPILISLRNHWSDLYLGKTRYGNNVFCLASELSKEKIEEHLSEIIMVKEVPTYLQVQKINGHNFSLK